MNKLDIFKKFTENTAKIKEILKEENNTKDKDETFWITPWDETKKIGSAVIAFLPFGNLFDEGENANPSPYIFIPKHDNLKGTRGKKYWNILCPSVKDNYQPGDCPFCEKFFEYFNGTEEDKKLGQSMRLSRTRQYYGNIIVIKNDKNPADVGKIFKWRFGVQIANKIIDKLNPMDDDDPIFVHNINNILPLKLKITEKGGFRNFESSEWGVNGKSVADYIIPKGSDADKEKFNEDICTKLYRTEDYVTDSDYKSLSDMKKILNDVLTFYNQDLVSNKEESINVETDIEEEKTLTDVIDEVDETNIEDELKETSESEIDSNDSDDIDIDSLFDDDGEN